jgi:hypothetical protein
MSLNLFIFFVFAFGASVFLGGVIQGNTGLASTTLTAKISETATTASVHDASGFGTFGQLVIGNETICYTGKTATTLTGLTRGEDCRSHSKVASHSSGARVYDEGAGLINTLVGFDIASAFSDGGLTGLVKGTFSSIKQLPAFVSAVARMLMWDSSYLDGPYVYYKYFILYPLSAGLVLSLVRLALGR